MAQEVQQELKVKENPQVVAASPNCKLFGQNIRFQECLKDTSDLDWESWHWQVKNRITTAGELTFLNLTKQEEEGLLRSQGRLAMGITPYWASLMDAQDSSCPLRRQAVPLTDEFNSSSHEMKDPCGEDKDSPVPGLVHRYPDRVLFIATEQCAMYCRHCTRRRLVGGRQMPDFSRRLMAAAEYIRENKKIRDCLISGGDPLMLEDNELEEILKTFRSIPTLEFLRIGTRVPITLPMRITPEFVQMLKKYKPLWMSVHVNHPKELTPRCRRALDLLSDSGIPLGSQTVLLKGINDRPSIMKKLMQQLLTARVRPYYIYQCDLAKGTMHFRTPISAGITIMEKLRGHTSGYAVPSFVVDAPGGGGKIPVGPDYVVNRVKGEYVLRNYRGKIYTYPE